MADGGDTPARASDTARRTRWTKLPARLDTPILFPGARGDHLNLNNWRNRVWYPALDAAGVSIFQLARLMGASVETIENHYAHLARDSEDTLRALLSARSGVLVASGDGADR